MTRTKGLAKTLERAYGDLDQNDKQLEGGLIHKPSVEEEDKLIAQRAALTERAEQIERQLQHDDPLTVKKPKEEPML